MSAVVIMFCISASTALGSIITTVICLGVVIDSQHRIRDDRIDSRQHLIWRTRDKIVGGVLAGVSGFWSKLRKRHPEGGEEHSRLLGN
jgi:hypothetical protein